MKKLSKKETATLKNLKAGLRNREIALAMEVSEKTISTYSLRIRKKLDLDNNANTYLIVATAIEKGVIQP